MPGEYSFPLKFTLPDKTKIEIIEFHGSFIAISDTQGLLGSTKKAFEFHILDLQNIDNFNNKKYIKDRLQRFTKITPQLQKKIDKIRKLKLAEDEKESDEKETPIIEKLPLTDIEQVDHYINRHNQGEEIECVSLDCSSDMASDNFKKFIRTVNTPQIKFIGKLRDKGIKVLVDDIMSNPHLIRVDLVDNDIGDEGASALSEALIFNKSLKGLCLFVNEIRVPGIKDLARALAYHESIVAINFSVNPGVNNDEAIEYLAQSLMTMPKLTAFQLAGQFGDRGLQALTNLIAGKENLHEVVISGRYGDESIRNLATTLKKNTSLTYIFINNVSDEGAKALAEVIKENNSLTSIDIRGNFGNEGLNALTLALADNTNLKSINFIGSFDKDGLNFFADNLDKNHTLTKVSATSPSTEMYVNLQIKIGDKIGAITARNKATEEIRNKKTEYLSALATHTPPQDLQSIIFDYFVVNPKKVKDEQKAINKKGEDSDEKENSDEEPADQAPSSSVAGLDDAENNTRFLKETEAKAKRKSERESRQGLGDDSDDEEPDLSFLKKPSKSPSPTEKDGVKKEDKEQQH